MSTDSVQSGPGSMEPFKTNDNQRAGQDEVRSRGRMQSGCDTESCRHENLKWLFNRTVKGNNLSSLFLCLNFSIDWPHSMFQTANACCHHLQTHYVKIYFQSTSCLSRVLSMTSHQMSNSKAQREELLRHCTVFARCAVAAIRFY